jgi:MarR family transcriptional regulator, organic hydroperoxide resistance regulator
VLEFMRLIWAVDHELQSVSKRMGTTLGLTVPQRMALLLLGRNAGLRASELASLLHLDPGTISGIIRRLEAAGMLTRAGDAKDGRRQRLALTARGRRSNARRAGTFQAAVRRTLVASSDADLGAAARVLARLASELRLVAGRSEGSKVRGPRVRASTRRDRRTTGPSDPRT